jgi:hypothetical protein
MTSSSDQAARAGADRRNQLSMDEHNFRIVTAQAIATMQNELLHVHNTVDRQNKTIEAQSVEIRRMNETMMAVNATLSQAAGSWKTLMWVGDMGAVLGAGVIWIADLWVKARGLK